MITHSVFQRECRRELKNLKSLAPYDTGNLANNAIKYEFPDPSVCVIYVDERVAPYMPYTTRPWVSPRWNGKKNPNEGWWQAAGELVAEDLAQKLGGELVHASNYTGYKR